jgi:fumarate hydratase subunit alpha
VEKAALSQAVKELSLQANYNLRPDVLEALEKAAMEEKEPLAQDYLHILLENANLAKENQTPICQDTGMVSVFLEVGEEVMLPPSLEEVVEESVVEAYQEGFLRNSMVEKPLFERNHLERNAPVFLHLEKVKGDSLKITVMPKGAGSENASFLLMLSPHYGLEGFKEELFSQLKEKIPYACPPVILGICAGANFEAAPLYAKKSLLEEIGRKNLDEKLSKLEKELLREINSWGIGPGALGGKTTVLAVHIVEYPTHMASLPMAVSISCHALRSASKVL